MTPGAKAIRLLQFAWISQRAAMCVRPDLHHGAHLSASSSRRINSENFRRPNSDRPRARTRPSVSTSPAPIRFPGARRCVRPPTGAKSLPTGIGFEGPRVVRQDGTSRAYLIERLRREGRADLVAAVESGQVSAYAVAVDLGWVTRHPTLGTGSTNQAKRREHQLNNVLREPSAATPPDRLNHEQDMSLTYGDLVGRPAFPSDEARRAAWLRHRDSLLRYCAAGQRPRAWWDYESPAQPRDFNYAAATLYENDLLGEEELRQLMARWREEFEKAQVPGFRYCAGFVNRCDATATWLKGAAARRARFKWAGIPRELLKEWTAERRRRNQATRRTASSTASSTDTSAA